MKKTALLMVFLANFFIAVSANSLEIAASAVPAARATVADVNVLRHQGATAVEVCHAQCDAINHTAEGELDLVSLNKLGAGLPDVAVSSMYELGFKEGHAFEGLSSSHEFSVFFPVVFDTAVDSGVVKVRYKTSSLANTIANMRIEINDHAATNINLSADAVVDGIDIPVTKGDIGVGYIKVTFKASILPSDNRCFDERALSLYYLQILPQTRLELNGISTATNTIRGAWSVLPKFVRVGVPETITPSTMKVILQVAKELRDSGKQLGFVKLPHDADVVVAERDLLVKMSATKPEAIAPTAKGDSNLILIHTDKVKRVIGVTDVASKGDLSMLTPGWRRIALGQGYKDTTPSNLEPVDIKTMQLREFGVDDHVRYISRTTEWGVFAGTPVVPGNLRIKALHLNVIAPPPERKESRVLIFVYLNNVLQEVRPLEDTGKPQMLTYILPDHDQWIGRNYVRIVAQRAAPSEKCTDAVASYPIQLLGDSYLEFEDSVVEPRIFNDLRSYFAKGFDLFVSPDVLKNEQLGLLSVILSDNDYDLTKMRFILLDEKTPFAPERPFMIFGRPSLHLDDMPIKFDQQQIQVVNDKKRVLLEVDNLTGVTMSQLVKHHGFSGLWVSPSDGADLNLQEYFLEQGDASFADDNNEMLNIVTKQMNRASIEYPKHETFMSKLGHYRFWIIAIGWMLLALSLVAVYRKVRSHQKH
jgi:hypothetical protein